jgi:PAS domain S-box-containing protein
MSRYTAQPDAVKVLLIGNDESALEQVHVRLRARGLPTMRRRELGSVVTGSDFGLAVVVSLGGGQRGMGAADSCRALRAVPGGDVPVILVLTDEEDPDALEALLEAGANDYLVWPRDAAHLGPRLAAAEQRASDRRRGRAERRAIEARYRVLLDQAPLLLHTTDAEGRVVSVSEGWLELLGYGREEVLGRLSLAFLSEPSRAQVADLVLPEFFARGHIRDLEHEFVRKDGATVKVRLWAVAERDVAGEIAGAFVIGVPM